MTLFFLSSHGDLRLGNVSAAGRWPDRRRPQFRLVDEYLAYSTDRNHSPKTVRSHAYDLLAFCRRLLTTGQPLPEAGTEVLLGFQSPGQGGTEGDQADRPPIGSVGRDNHQPKAGCNFGPVRRFGGRARRLPTALLQFDAGELLASLRTWRDRAITGLMLYCGLRSAEVLALDVADVDIGGRWLRPVDGVNQQRTNKRLATLHHRVNKKPGQSRTTGQTRRS